jgi:hypothetical protein
VYGASWHVPIDVLVADMRSTRNLRSPDVLRRGIMIVTAFAGISGSPGNSRGLLLSLTAHRRNHQIIEFSRKVCVSFCFTRVPLCRRLLRALHE